MSTAKASPDVRLPLLLRHALSRTDNSPCIDHPTLVERRPREVRVGASCSSQTFTTKVQRETTDDD